MRFETREVRSHVLADATGATLEPALRKQADLPNTLHTDGSKSYDVAAPHVYEHEWEDDTAGKYVGRAAASTNTVEGRRCKTVVMCPPTYPDVSRGLEDVSSVDTFRWFVSRLPFAHVF